MTDIVRDVQIRISTDKTSTVTWNDATKQLPQVDFGLMTVRSGPVLIRLEDGSTGVGVYILNEFDDEPGGQTIERQWQWIAMKRRPQPEVFKVIEWAEIPE